MSTFSTATNDREAPVSESEALSAPYDAPPIEPQPLTPPRYHALDSLRASMMFLGVVLHAAMPYLPILAPFVPYSDPSAQNDLFGLITFTIHKFRMPIFFVMAGFFGALLLDRRGARGMLVNRFQRIALPFIAFWFVLFSLIEGTTSYMKTSGGIEGLRQALDDYINGRLWADPNPVHLWFLYYLIFYYPAAVGLIALADKYRPSLGATIQKAFRWVMQSRARALLLAIPTTIPFLLMPGGDLDTPLVFLPSLTILACHGLFFGFGWLLYSNAEFLTTFPRDAWKQITLAMVLTISNLIAVIAQFAVGSTAGKVLLVFAAITSATITWLFIFGITGLFVKYLHRSSPTIRYLTDASYWCYLVHYPFVYWIAAGIAPWPVNSFVKYLTVIAIDTFFILLTYHLLVRSTRLGTWLNGRSYPFRLRWPWSAPKGVGEPVVIVSSLGNVPASTLE